MSHWLWNKVKEKEEQLEAAQTRVKELEGNLQLLVTTARYCVNRLDTDKEQPQVSGDLAIALAHVESRTDIVAKFGRSI